MKPAITPSDITPQNSSSVGSIARMSRPIIRKLKTGAMPAIMKFMLINSGSSGDRPSRLRFNARLQYGRAVLDPFRVKATRPLGFFGRRRDKSSHRRRHLRKFRFGAQAVALAIRRTAFRL